MTKVLPRRLSIIVSCVADQSELTITLTAVEPGDGKQASRLLGVTGEPSTALATVRDELARWVAAI